MNVSRRAHGQSLTQRPRDHHFRGSLGRFATGVAIVTFEVPAGEELRDSSNPENLERQEGKYHGITINSFTSVSMDPPLVLASIARSSRSHDLMMNRPFTVNILGAEQQWLANHFAGKPNREPHWVKGQFAPRLSGVLAYFECTPWAAYDGGDHTLYLGEVVDFDYRNGDALAFANSRFTTIPESQLGVENLW